jgi:hypothetical protein
LKKFTGLTLAVLAMLSLLTFLMACQRETKSAINIQVDIIGPQTLKDGEFYEIRWVSQGAPEGSRVGIAIIGLADKTESWGYGVGLDGSKAHLPPNLPPSGSLQWVARDFPGSTNFYRIQASLYVPGAEHYNYPTFAQGRSKDFNIEVPGGPRNIKILEPNEEDVLKAGSTRQIRWESVAVPPDANIILELRPEGLSSELGGIPLGVTKNAGTYQWSVPPDITSGRYKIGIFWVADYEIYNAQNESQFFRVE